MSKLLRIDTDYARWVEALGARFQSSRVGAALHVNREMLRFYWSLGEDMFRLQAEVRWGSGFMRNLESDLRDALPGVRGFSFTNLNYIKRFYLMFREVVPNFPQPGGKLSEDLFSIPWGHVKVLIDKFYGDSERAIYYLRKVRENNWSRAVLLNFVETNLFEREGRADSNFMEALPAPQGDLAQALTRDPYNFDFAGIRDRYDERGLKDALMANIQRFLLELGTGFAFVGREYRLQVGKTEQFLDMLFFNIRLNAYVVVEVKVRELLPGDIGQVGTYVAAVDDLLRQPGHNPTVGILICKSKDSVLAKYALRSSSQPIGVSEYELERALDAKVADTLPTIEELERGLSE